LSGFSRPLRGSTRTPRRVMAGCRGLLGSLSPSPKVCPLERLKVLGNSTAPAPQLLCRRSRAGVAVYPLGGRAVPSPKGPTADVVRPLHCLSRLHPTPDRSESGQSGGRPMTEKEWLAGTYPTPMLEYLRGKASDRMLLLACACCRRGWELLAPAD